MQKIFMFYIVILTILLIPLVSCASSDKIPEYNKTIATVSIPDPGKETGVIFGYLLSPTKNPIDESVYLTKDIAFYEPGLPVTVTFSYQSDPRGKIDANTGMFLFDKVEPAENYIIAILTGSGKPVFVMDQTGDQPMVFSVDAGESVNLGEIIMDID